MSTTIDTAGHNEKDISNVHHALHSSIDDSGREDGPNGTALSSGDRVDTSFQPGVQDIEAVTIQWSKTSLIIGFVMIWFIYFIQGLVQVISGALLPYVTSAFAEHSLTATTGVMASVIGGVTNLSIGKSLDIFGRPQGFLICVVFCTLGLIMSAVCNNVETYAAAQVFYTVGISGIGFTLSVFVADTTTLRHRGLIQSISSTGFVITAWLGGPISTAFLNGAGWRWAFGMESILIPTVTLPLFGLFMFHYAKAKKQGLVPKRGRGRTALESLMYYLREFDIVGILVLSAGVAFFLLPFNLYTFQAQGWSSPLIICFFVFGILLLISFGIWERLFAPVSFIPWNLLKDRTVAGACLLAFAYFLSLACWGLYLSSILQVVNNLTVTRASYVQQIQTVAGFIFAIAIGGWISFNGRFKPVTLYFAVPLVFLGSGLMIYFRQPNGNIGYIVMAQLFIAFGGGAVMLCDEIAVLAAVKEQQFFAVSIALISMCSSIGNAVGYTISSAIWQDVLPKKLAIYLPVDQQANLTMIYSDIVTQLSFPVGSDTRLAIQHAYGDTQRYLFIAGTASWVLGLVAVLMWRNINTIGIKQTKGRVF
jgi:MFS family permease